MNRMEYKGISSTTPSLEAWGDIAKYEAFVKELDSWKEEAKLAAMEKYPSTFDTAEEPVIEEAYVETLRRAQESGPREKGYFLKRLEIMRFQKSGAAPAPTLATPEATPAVVPLAETEVEVEPSLPEEEMAVAEGPESDAVVTAPESAVSPRVQRLAGFADRIRAVRTNGGVAAVSSVTAQVTRSEAEQPKGFAALAGFVPEKKFDTLAVSREADIVDHVPAHGEPSAVIEEVIAPEEVVASPAPEVAPVAAVASNETTEAVPSVAERVARSIENGSFDLSLATAPQLEALLHHPSAAIVDRATRELSFRKTATDAVRGPASVAPEEGSETSETSDAPHAEVVAETPAPVEPVASPETPERVPVTKEVVLETLRAGRSIPPVFLKKFMNDPDVRALLEASGGKEDPTPSATLAPVAAVAGIARVVPDEAAVEAARAAHEADTAIVNESNLSFSEVPEPVAPRLDGMAGGPDIAPVEEVVTPEVVAVPKTWGEMNDQEQSMLTKACVLHYRSGEPYRVKQMDGTIEEWALLSVSDEGSALFEKKLSPDDRQVKRVGLLELMELNPFDVEAELLAEAPSVEGITVTEAEVEEVTLAETPGGESLVREVAESRAEWNAMSLEDRTTFLGHCEFLFSIGRPYAIKRTDGTIEDWVLLALGADGMATMASIDGKMEKRVPLRELHDLNMIVSRTGATVKEEEEEDAEDDGEDLPFPEMKPLVAEQFKDTFGMGSEALLAIPEFAALSEGQQLLVHHELNNYAVSQIKADALKAYREKYQSLQGSLSDFEKKQLAREGLFGGIAKIGVGLAQLRHKEMWQKAGMSIFKRKFIAEEEKALAAQVMSGNMDAGAYIRELALEAKEGPDAIIENGSVRLQFLKQEDLGALSESEAEMVRAFNTHASAFAGLPHQWKERGATEVERTQYEAGETAYRDALDRVLVLLNTKGEGADALLDVNELDRRITFTQFFNTHPEAALQLANLKDQNVWLTAVKDIARTRGTLFALGGTVRTAAAAVASSVFSAGAMFIAAPLAGAATGGYMGKKRAETELTERELLAKSGVKDQSGEALNIVDAGSRSHESGRTLMGLSGKLNQLILEIEATDDKEITLTPLARQAPAADGTRGEILAAAPLGETAGAEHELVGSSRAIERNKKADLLAELERRISYTQEKLDQGLVNYGGKEEQIQNQYTLLRAISKAKALLLIEGKKDLDATPIDQSTGEAYDTGWRKDTRSARERLADLLVLRDQQISEAQKTYVERTTKQAALYGAAFAFGGAVVADMVHGMVTPGGSVIGRLSDEVRDLKTGGGSEEGVAALAGAGVAGKEALVAPTQGGWDSPLVQKSLTDPVFTKDYVHGMSIFTGRTESVGMSDAELNALLATDDVPGRETAHQALIVAMRNSPTRLSDESVAKIMLEHRVPSGVESTVVAAATAPRVSGAEVAPVALPAAYLVKGGDNLSLILKDHIPALKGLSSGAQENVIQNFLRSQSPEQLRALGIADPNSLVIDQPINLEQLNAALSAQQIQGESLVAHAQRLSGEVSAPVAAPAAVSEVLPPPQSGSAAPVATEAVGAPSVPKAPVAEVMEPQPVAPVKPALSNGSEVAGIDRPRALTLAEEYITKDMTDPRTGKFSPLWLEGKGFNAKFIMTLKESDVTPELWQKVLAIRKYTTAQGFDASHQIIPTEKETLEEFFRRGHAERVLQDGERGARTVVSSAAIRQAPVVTQPAPAPRATAPAFEPTRLPRPNPNVEINTPVVPPAAPVATPTPVAPSSAGYQYRSMNDGAPDASEYRAAPPQAQAPMEQIPPQGGTPGGYQYRRLP